MELQNGSGSGSSGAAAAQYKKTGNALKDIFDWVESIIVAVVTIIVIFTFLLRTTMVDGNSMNPTLANEDRLIITDLFYEPTYNDIVVLQANGLVNEKGEYGKPIVKRVIGLAGDTIDIDFESGTVYRNGTALEVKLDGASITEDGHKINELTHEKESFTEAVTVPDGYIFVMGDNRNRSTDSRSSLVGCVDTHYIIGKAIYRILPFSSFGGLY